MKVCIEQVEGGFSVYQEGGNAPEANNAGGPVGMGGVPAESAGAGQSVATVEEALQLAGSMLSGGGKAEQDDASADALFQSGFQQAMKQR